MERKALIEHTENLLNKPPVAVLVFDDWRGEGHFTEHLAASTMLTRCAIAANLYHSALYQEGNRPKILCFAGKHTPDSPAGSAQVARILKDNFEIDENDITTAETTNTTSLDITAFHSWSKSHAKNGPLAIATTNDHVQRLAQEWINHFEDHETPQTAPLVYILSPQNAILSQLVLDDSCPLGAKEQMLHHLEVGNTNRLNSGFTEIAAAVISGFPATPRKIFQPFAEKKAHQYQPIKQRRILKSAKALHSSLERRKYIQQEEEISIQIAGNNSKDKL